MKKPIIAISTRDQRDLVKIYKAFYVKYPHLTPPENQNAPNNKRHD